VVNANADDRILGGSGPHAKRMVLKLLRFIAVEAEYEAK
jgi:hypothetical protein